jgi:hypothetical protein
MTILSVLVRVIGINLRRISFMAGKWLSFVRPRQRVAATRMRDQPKRWYKKGD